MHSPLFFLKIVEIKDFALRVAILDDRECQICFGSRPLGTYIRKRQDGRPNRYSLNHVVSFAAVIRVVIGEERCVTTLITAAKETINHDDLPKNRGLWTV